MLLLFVGLFAMASISEASTSCFDPSCERIVSPLEFPVTQEELNVSCRSFLEYMACIKEVYETCEKDVDENDQTLPKIIRFMSFAERACNTETSLYRAVADNIVCIKQEIFKDHCRLDIKEKEDRKKLEDQLKQQGITVSADEGNDALLCAHQLYLFACRSANVGEECGNEARDATTEIFQHLIKTTDYCSDERIDELPNIVEILQLENSKAEKLEEKFEERK